MAAPGSTRHAPERPLLHQANGADGNRRRRPVKRCGQLPTIEAPRKLSTCPIGLAIALVELPANSRPTARGLVVASSTISEPESPLLRKRDPLFLITSCP